MNETVGTVLLVWLRLQKHLLYPMGDIIQSSLSVISNKSLRQVETLASSDIIRTYDGVIVFRQTFL
jgi:hypothetical protein